MFLRMNGNRSRREERAEAQVADYVQGREMYKGSAENSGESRGYFWKRYDVEVIEVNV